MVHDQCRGRTSMSFPTHFADITVCSFNHIFWNIFFFSWVFGEFLCRMYQFVHSLSYTASIFILVVICMERYFAIVHPITCKQILTAARLRVSNRRHFNENSFVHDWFLLAAKQMDGKNVNCNEMYQIPKMESPIARIKRVA